jgi:hypothetical protein
MYSVLVESCINYIGMSKVLYASPYNLEVPWQYYHAIVSSAFFGLIFDFYVQYQPYGHDYIVVET